MYHIDGMLAARKTLEKLGYEIETPDLSESHNYDSLPLEERAAEKDRLIREHLDKISESDAIFVFNEAKKGIAGYVGGNSLMEMAFAYAQGIEIFLLNDASAMGYADEILGMRPITLNGKVEAIHEYFSSLPRTFVSSKSPIKLRAISRGMRKSGIRTQVLPRPTSSNVSEQPMNIEETYEGAQNRHAALRATSKGAPPAYLATVESGFSAMHAGHNVFESMVVILEKVGAETKTGITVAIEYPKTMTDKVPSHYQDIGELVQIEYGSKLKDPFPHFTGGKLSRLQLVEQAVFTVAAQL